MNNIISFLMFLGLMISWDKVHAGEFASEEVPEHMRFEENADEKKDAQIIQDFPELKKFLYQPPKAPVYIGIGVTPLGIMGSKLYFGLNLFQAHYLTSFWDIELLSVSIGQATSNKDFANSRHFYARTSPKIVVMNIFQTGTISIGPMAGVEFVSFSQIPVKKINPNNTSEITPQYEDLTTSGFFYGLQVSETFTLAKDRRFKMNQVIFKQSYDVDKSEYGWTFDYQDPSLALAANKKEFAASTVFLLEFSYLF
jgi:hypothetical protein